MLNTLPPNHKELLEQAEKARDFTPLIPYPSLLFFYQYKHPESIKDIAKIASHKLGHHKFCEATCTDIQPKVETFKGTDIPVAQDMPF